MRVVGGFLFICSFDLVCNVMCSEGGITFLCKCPSPKPKVENLFFLRNEENRDVGDILHVVMYRHCV